MPDIGRFFNIDPLADKYVYNSPYAFSENKVVAHRELEGLEAEPVNTESERTIKAEFNGKGNVRLTYSGGMPGDATIGVSREDGKISPVVQVGELPEVKEGAESKGDKAPNMKIQTPVAQKDLGGPKVKSNIDMKLQKDAKIAVENTAAKLKQEQQKSQTSGSSGQQNQNNKQENGGSKKLDIGPPEKNNQNKSTDDKQKTDQQQKVNQ